MGGRSSIPVLVVGHIDLDALEFCDFAHQTVHTRVRWIEQSVYVVSHLRVLTTSSEALYETVSGALKLSLHLPKRNHTLSRPTGSTVDINALPVGLLSDPAHQQRQLSYSLSSDCTSPFVCGVLLLNCVSPIVCDVC